MARSLGEAPEEIKRRHIATFTKCGPAYGAGIAKRWSWPVERRLPNARRLETNAITFFSPSDHQELTWQPRK
jgi:hypothetical protein